jgi:hypothetical protein
MPLGLLAALLLQEPRYPACTAEVRICEVALPSSAVLRALLGPHRQAWRVRNGVLTVLTRRSEPASLCCSIQTALRPVGDLQAISLRIPDVEPAILDVRVMTRGEWSQEHDVYRGPAADPAAGSPNWD